MSNSRRRLAHLRQKASSTRPQNGLDRPHRASISESSGERRGQKSWSGDNPASPGQCPTKAREPPGTTMLTMTPFSNVIVSRFLEELSLKNGKRWHEVTPELVRWPARRVSQRCHLATPARESGRGHAIPPEFPPRRTNLRRTVLDGPPRMPDLSMSWAGQSHSASAPLVLFLDVDMALEGSTIRNASCLGLGSSMAAPPFHAVKRGYPVSLLDTASAASWRSRRLTVEPRERGLRLLRACGRGRLPAEFACLECIARHPPRLK